MHNKIINLALVAQVAKGLKELNEKMVFIGGAVISLYTDDPAAEEIRPTSDIDMTINLANYYEWTQMQERLAELNFYPDPQGQSICSYQFENIAISVWFLFDGVDFFSSLVCCQPTDVIYFCFP